MKKPVARVAKFIICAAASFALVTPARAKTTCYDYNRYDEIEVVIRDCNDEINAHYSKHPNTEPVIFYLNRGRAYETKGDYVSAIADFSKIISYDSLTGIYDEETSLAFMFRAKVYGEKGESKRAFSEFGNALAYIAKKRPGGSNGVVDLNGRVFLERGQLHTKMGNSALAIVDLTNAINAHSSEPYGYPDGYAARAEAYGASGDDTREIADWQKVIRATSRHEFIDRMLLSAAVGIGRGQYTRAITICELIMVRESFNLNALLLRAEAFNATSQFDRAIADLTTAIKFDPQDDELFFTRGKTFLTKGDQNGAIADFGTAISLEPNEPAYRIARARIFQMTGHLDEANKDFGEAGRLQSARIGR